MLLFRRTSLTTLLGDIDEAQGLFSKLQRKFEFLADNILNQVANHDESASIGYYYTLRIFRQQQFGILMRLAHLSTLSQDFPKAEAYLRQAITARLSVDGEGSLGNTDNWFTVLRPLSRLATVHLRKGDLNRASSIWFHAFDVFEERFRRTSPLENERLLLTEMYAAKALTDDVLSAISEDHLLFSNPSLLQVALAAVLFTQGRVADEMANRSATLIGIDSEESRNLMQRLRELRISISTMELSSLADQDQANYHRVKIALEAEASALEQKLQRLSSPGLAPNQLPWSREIISKPTEHIPPDGIMVNYVYYCNSDVTKPPTKQQCEHRYLALLLKRDGTIAVVELGKAEPIDDMANNLRRALVALAWSGG